MTADRSTLLGAVDLGPLLQRLTGIEARGERYPCPHPEHAQTGLTPPVSLGNGDGPYQVWRCHGCGAGGSAVDALMLARGLSGGDALRELGSDSVPPRQVARSRAVRAHDVDPLPTAAQVEAWALALHQRPDLLGRMRTRKGWTPGAAAALDVGWDGQHFTFPIHKASGQLVNVVRYLPDGRPKSLAARGRPRDMFPAPELLAGEQVRRANGRLVALADVEPIYVVEGESDAVAALSIGLTAFAVPGASGWKPVWASRLAGFDVHILVDDDTAGRQLADRLAADLLPHASRVRLLSWPALLGSPVPEGFDMCDYAAQRAAATRCAA